MSAVRRWKTEAEIETQLEAFMQKHRLKSAEDIRAMIDGAMAERWDAWEKRMGPTLDTMRDGAQSSLMTNMLLVGDSRFEVKGFITETRDRFTALETRTSQMHEQNIRLGKKVIRRQGTIMRCLRWITGKDRKGTWRLVGLGAGAAGFGSGLTSVVHYWPKVVELLHAHIR